VSAGGGLCTEPFANGTLSSTVEAAMSVPLASPATVKPNCVFAVLQLVLR
jgi:hypothetical protein